jgi:hypothetical protein
LASIIRIYHEARSYECQTILLLGTGKAFSRYISIISKHTLTVSFNGL